MRWAARRACPDGAVLGDALWPLQSINERSVPNANAWSVSSAMGDTPGIRWGMAVTPT